MSEKLKDVDGTGAWVTDAHNKMRTAACDVGRSLLLAVSNEMLAKLVRRVRAGKVEDEVLTALILTEAARRLDPSYAATTLKKDESLGLAPIRSL